MTYGDYCSEDQKNLLFSDMEMDWFFWLPIVQKTIFVLGMIALTMYGMCLMRMNGVTYVFTGLIIASSIVDLAFYASLQVTIVSTLAFLDPQSNP